MRTDGFFTMPIGGFFRANTQYAYPNRPARYMVSPGRHKGFKQHLSIDQGRFE
jgi:hypothetical protein